MPPSISCVVQLYSLIAIVLMSLGAALIVAAPLALLPVPTLTGVAAVTFVLGPFVNAAARGALDPFRLGLQRRAALAALLTGVVAGVVVGALAAGAFGVLLLHVALIALVLGTLGWAQIRADWLLLASGVLIGTILACWAWWSLFGKGPIERLMALVTDPIGRADGGGVASFTASGDAPDGRARVPCHHGREHRSPHPCSRGDAPGA